MLETYLAQAGGLVHDNGGVLTKSHGVIHEGYDLLHGNHEVNTVGSTIIS